MAVTYTWQITTLKKMDTQQHEDVVVQAYWNKKGTDETGVFGIFSGVTSFTLNPNEQFIPFDQLEEQQVLQWIQAATADNEQNMNSDIQRQINDKKSTVTRMPWDPISPA